MATDRRSRPKILVTGGTGQVGFELMRAFASMGEVIAPSRSTLDLTDPAAIASFVRRLRPQIVLNAAAYTAVDRAEKEVAMAHAVNAHAPEVLAVEARRTGALLLHYSTDYVFDGSKAAPYQEQDPTSPLNVYGATKLAGEQAVLAAHDEALVLRSSWVYGLRGTNFLLTVRRLAAAGGPLRIVDDQWGSPTWCRSIAQASARILSGTGEGGELRLRGQPGLYHLACSGCATWCAFARRIVALGDDPSVVVEPIATSDYPTAARRPSYSVLDCSLLEKTFKVVMPSWQDALELALAG